MPAFSTNHQTAAGTDLGLINLTGSAAIRVAIFEIILSSDASPADLAGEFALNLTTDVGVGGTTLPENALEPISSSTPAAIAAAVGGTFGTQPADTANSERLQFALNQKSTFRWAALADKYRICSIAASGNGLMLRSVAHGGTPNMNCTIMWDE